MTALIDQLHNELKLKDEAQVHLRSQIEMLQQQVVDGKKQIVKLQVGHFYALKTTTTATRTVNNELHLGGSHTATKRG